MKKRTPKGRKTMSPQTKTKAKARAKRARANRIRSTARSGPADQLFNRVDEILARIADESDALLALLPAFKALPPADRSWIYDHIDIVVGGGIDYTADKFAENTPDVANMPASIEDLNVPQEVGGMLGLLALGLLGEALTRGPAPPPFPTPGPVKSPPYGPHRRVIIPFKQLTPAPVITPQDEDPDKPKGAA